MPNIITHTLFADDFLKDCSEEIKEWLEPRKRLFEKGANGPDFLFFHNLCPSRICQSTQLRKLGHLAHSGHVNDFYACAIESIQKEKDDEIRLDMIAYTMGHLLHWALDSTTHPFVYNRTGHGTAKSVSWHHRYESMIDAIVLKVKREQTIQDFKSFEITQPSIEEARAIARIYVPVAKNVFGIAFRPYQVLECLNDWTFMQKVFYDASGKKSDVLIKLESILNQDALLSGYIVPNRPEDPFDTMNLLHKTWCHPCDKQDESNQSFFDLYDQAMDLAFQVCGVFLAAVKGEQDLHLLLDVLGDRNYNTGTTDDISCMQHFDLVYEP